MAHKKSKTCMKPDYNIAGFQPINLSETFHWLLFSRCENMKCYFHSV